MKCHALAMFADMGASLIIVANGLRLLAGEMPLSHALKNRIPTEEPLHRAPLFVKGSIHHGP